MSAQRSNTPLWAKASKASSPLYHDLFAHMIDVACVAEELLVSYIPRRRIARLASELGSDADDNAVSTTAFLAGCHDLGKATPGFQAKVPEYKDELKRAGFEFRSVATRDPRTFRHDIATAALLPSVIAGLAPAWCSRRRWLEEVAKVIGGHHGVFPDDGSIYRVSLVCGGDDWGSLRLELLASLARVLSVDLASVPASLPRSPSPDFCIFLAGLTSVADWVASDEQRFPFTWPIDEQAAYLAVSRARAKKAVRDIGFQAPPANENRPVPRVFIGQAARWRPIQEAAIALAKDIRQPSLVIIETETGSGKTEAAWIIADALIGKRLASGLYTAMPTQATSNSMHDRMKCFLRRRFRYELSDVQLVHSGSAFRRWERVGLNQPDESGTTVDIAASSWFAPKKRTLLAAFGVGTVDQGLLAVMLARHSFVRMFALSGKVVVFDEVHAYDLYMFTLFKRLLRWLGQSGISVVILSATLPEASRRELIAAYTGSRPGDVDGLCQPYPRISWVGSTGALRQLSVKPSPDKTISLRMIGDQPGELMEELKPRLERGGCVAVVCNTVRRAQELYRCRHRLCDQGGVETILFHSRFQSGRRSEIEREVCERFSKPGVSAHRPGKALVIATQVIEQSLDLDFDFMVTDLAPIDLLVQRAGRLWRHERPPAQRGAFERPELWVRVPAGDDGNHPHFDALGKVYHTSLLFKTWAVLRNASSITIPGDLDRLIEYVYGDTPPDVLSDAERTALDEMLRNESEDDAKVARQAYRRLMRAPDDELSFLSQFQPGLSDDEDPALHSDLRALTRLGGPSVSVIVLHRWGDTLSLTCDGSRLVDMNVYPDVETALALAKCAIDVPCPAWNADLLKSLIELPHPDTWRKHPLLRGYRLLEMRDGKSANMAGVTLILDQELGLLTEYDRIERKTPR